MSVLVQSVSPLNISRLTCRRGAPTGSFCSSDNRPFYLLQSTPLRCFKRSYCPALGARNRDRLVDTPGSKHFQMPLRNAAYSRLNTADVRLSRAIGFICSFCDRARFRFEGVARTLSLESRSVDHCHSPVSVRRHKPLRFAEPGLVQWFHISLDRSKWISERR
jgi:hypothetical protein